MSAKKKNRPKPAAAPVPPQSSFGETVGRGALSTLLGWLILAGTALVLPGTPYTPVILAGFAIALMFDSTFAFVPAVVVTLIGTVMIGLREPLAVQAWMYALLPLLAAGAAFGGYYARKRVSVAILAAVVLAVLVLGFGWQSLQVTPQVAQMNATEPADEAYAFDPVFFTKVYYMVDRGVPFYQAYGEGFAKDKRFEEPTRDLAGWRSPTTVWLWSALFRNGSDMVWGFVLFAMLSMVLAYYVAMRVGDPASALVAPALLFPYYLYAVPSLWFTELEFWAGFAALGAAALWVSEKRWGALGVAALAGAMREWLMSSLAAGVVDNLRQRRWAEAAAWGAGSVAAVVFYLANMQFVIKYLRSVGISPSLGAESRAGQGGIDFILYTLQFCSSLFLNSNAVPYIVLFLALAVAGYLMYRGEFYVPMLLILPLIAFLYFGSPVGPGDDPGWNDYYNAAFMPFAIILAASSPRLLELLAPKGEAA